MLEAGPYPLARPAVFAGAAFCVSLLLSASPVTGQSSKPGVASPTGATAAGQPRSTQKSGSTATPPSADAQAAARRARAAARARAARELQPPRFKVDGSGMTVPAVRAEAAIVYDPVTHEVLWAENENEERSIASITKVMTVVTFLENEFDLSRVVAVDRADLRRASITYLRAGDRLTVHDLLHLTLIASDNAAARTLARVSPFGPEEFIVRMNQKAAALGLLHTRYADPSGLNAENVSSAYDMARLIAFAASDARIAPIMQKTSHTITTARRTFTVRSTNRLLESDVTVLAGKTGFIRRAGYCFASLIRLPNSEDLVAVVVLGAQSSAARFWETRHIFNWLVSRTSQLLPAAASTQE
jgi:D-alanyl-D-alanine endopeptidase (penicillin-binding protein 7)